MPGACIPLLDQPSSLCQSRATQLQVQVQACLDLRQLFHNSGAGAEKQLQERCQHLWQGPVGPGNAARALRDNILHPRLTKV